MKYSGFLKNNPLCFMGNESNIVTIIVVHNSSEGSLLNNVLQTYIIVLG